MSNDIFPTAYTDNNQPSVHAPWLNDVAAAVWGAIGTGRGGTPPTTPAQVKANLAITGADASYTPPGTGAVTTTVSAEFSYLDMQSVFNWMTPTQITDVLARTLTQDVTSAVQAAINATAGNAAFSQTLYFPPGSYKITSSLNLLSNLTLKGDGMWGTPFSGWTASSLLVLQTASTSLFSTNVGYFTNCTIDGLGLLGDYASYASQYGINLQDSARTAVLPCGLQVKNSLIKWFNIGFFAGYKYQSVVFDNVAFISCQTYGMQYRSTDSWFYKTWFGNSNEGGHTTNATQQVLLDSDGTHWGGFNTFVGGGWYGAATNVLKIVQQNSNAFINLNFQLCQNTGVQVGDGSTGVADNGFIGCLFNENNNSGAGGQYDILVSNLATGTKIVGNTFGAAGIANKPNNPILLSDTSNGTIITGNVFNMDYYTTTTPIIRTSATCDYDNHTIRGNRYYSAINSLSYDFGVAETQPQYNANGAIAISPGVAIVNGSSLAMTLKDPTVVNRRLAIYNGAGTSATVTTHTAAGWDGVHAIATISSGGYLDAISITGSRWTVLSQSGVVFS